MNSFRPFAIRTASTIRLSIAFAVLVTVADPSVAFADDAAPDPPPPPPTASAAPIEEAPPASTDSPSYIRHGFTMELGLGLSTTATIDQDHSKIGLAPLSFGFGGFLSPRLALIARGAGSSFQTDDAKGRSYDTVNAFYGPTLQYWPTDRFYVGGGVGLAVLAIDPFGASAYKVQSIDTGVGLNARAGWAFALPGDHNALLLGLEAFGSRFEKYATVATALNLGWQFF